MVSPMRSPRKVNTSNWMPGNFFKIPSICFFIFSSSSAGIRLSSTCSSQRCGPQGSSPSSALPACCSTLYIFVFLSNSAERCVPIRIISGNDVPGAAKTCKTKWPSRNSGRNSPPAGNRVRPAIQKTATKAIITRGQRATKPSILR